MGARPKQADLQAAGKDLQKVLKPTEKFDPKAKPKAMMTWIEEAADLLVKGDNIKKSTADVLEQMDVSHKATVPEAAKPKAKAKAKAKPAKAKAEKPKAKAKPAKAKAEKPKAKAKMTRIESVIATLKKFKKPIPRAELAEKANELFESKGGADNLKESKWAVSIVAQVLTVAGAAEEDDKGIKRV